MPPLHKKTMVVIENVPVTPWGYGALYTAGVGTAAAGAKAFGNTLNKRMDNLRGTRLNMRRTRLASGTLAGVASKNRYVSRKVFGKRRGGGKPKRSKLLTYADSFKTTDLLNAYCPKVTWNMVGTGVIDEVSNVGRQEVVASNTIFRICRRDSLRKIYHKLYMDNCYQLQLLSRGKTNDQVTASGADFVPLQGATDGIPSDPNNWATNYNAFNAEKMPTLCCYGYKRVYTMLNPSSTTTTVTIWECVPKEDMSDSAKVVWANSMAQGTDPSLAGTPQLNNGGNYGLNTMATNKTAPTSEMTYDLTDPYRRPHYKYNQDFYKKYFVIKKSVFQIEAGATLKYTVNIPGFKITYKNLYDPLYAADDMIKNLTVNAMFIINGEKCYDNSGGVQKTSLMAGAVNIQYKDYTHWRMRPIIKKYFNFTTNAPDDFNIDFDKDEYYPVAIAPTVAIPTSMVPSVDIPTTDIEG